MKSRMTLATIVASAACLAISALFANGAHATANGTIHGTVTATTPRFLTGALAYLVRVPGSHPPPAAPVTMDQRNHQFLPHVLPVVVGTTVRFLNSDMEAHNVYSPDGEKYDLGNWTQGEHRDYTFRREGVYTQLCHLHPSMLGFVVVLQNPFYADVGADGTFTIANVPPGHYQLKVWQERAEAGPVEVTVTADGTVEVTATMARRH